MEDAKFQRMVIIVEVETSEKICVLSHQCYQVPLYPGLFPKDPQLR